MYSGFADAELLCSSADSGMILNNVHSEFLCSLFDIISHFRHLQAVYADRVYAEKQKKYVQDSIYPVHPAELC